MKQFPKLKLPKPNWPKLRRIFGRIGAVTLMVVLWLVLMLYVAMFILAKGPSPTASNMFVRSVQETSAVGFLARLFFSQAQIDRITGAGEEPEYQEMDTSLIVMTQPDEQEEQADQGPQKDAWGLVDEDGDGIILETVTGESYSGYMMVVLDPSRVIMGSVPSSYEVRGYTVAQMAKRFDAVAATNAGGFDDPGGKGDGSTPSTMVVVDGRIYYSELGSGGGFAGFDSDHILHVGKFSVGEIRERDIQYGVGFGPVLIVNGAPVKEFRSGVNPRTAIGQRADGAVLLLVIDGRQVTSLGATYQDLVEVFLSYGAVNACNLDGGSSSLLWHEGEYVNSCASVLGIRPVPTTFLVLKEGDHE